MKNLRHCEYVQQIEHLPIPLPDLILRVKEIYKYAYIVHDKDKDENGNTKPPHLHLYMNFGTPRDLSTISKIVCDEENRINKIFGRSGDMLAYLTHANAPDKYQYDSSEVIANFEWEKERDETLSKKSDFKRLDEIVVLIDTGLLREYNKHEQISAKEFVKWKRQIDSAFLYRSSKLQNGVDRSMECVYIYGDSSTGKTTFSKQIAKDKGYSIFVSSGSNDILDGYCGQDCIILDDLRPSCLGLSDLLKLLDNNTASSVKSRYKNKVLECKMIVITTTIQIEEFFQNVFAEQPETKIQLMRRCKTCIYMTKEQIQLSVWDDFDGRYNSLPAFKNPVQYIRKAALTDSDRIDQVKQILGATFDNLKIFQDSLDNGDVKQIFTDIPLDPDLPF